MNTRKLYFILTIFLLIAALAPVSAQNSPAGALAAGNVINRDIDTYMMVNFAPYLNYDKFFTFFQTSMYSAYMTNPGDPGFQAGFATKFGGSFMNFFLNTSGVSLDSSLDEIDRAGNLSEKTEMKNKFNLQFDTIYGRPDLGTFKLGLNFSDFGKEESYDNNKSTGDYSKTTIKSGFFTPSLAFGKNIINNDFSMWLLSGTVRFRFPLGAGMTIEEDKSGAVTTTTSTTPSLITPSIPFNGSRRLEIEPQMWYFFKPKLEPMVVISHIYLLNTFVMMFYPEERTTVEMTGISDNGYERRKHDYVGNTLFGYYNRQYSVTSKLTLAWRINFAFGFYNSKQDYTYSRTPGGTETVDKVTDQELYFVVTMAPRLAFSYQLAPAKFIINGSVMFNQLGRPTEIGWQYYRRTKTDDANDTVSIQDQHSFTGINPVFSLGAAWNLSPFLILEGGVSIATAGANSPLSDISIAVVYKK